MKIYIVLPDMLNNGGIKVGCQWANILEEAGYESYVATPEAKINPWINLNFKNISWPDIEDNENNKVIFCWIPDLRALTQPIRIPILRLMPNIFNKLKKSQKYFYAQDCAQFHYFGADDCIKLIKQTKLITIGYHSRWWYLYKYGINSTIVNNYIDQSIFSYNKDKEKNTVCMIKHRDHISNEVIDTIKKMGLKLILTHGEQQKVARDMKRSEYFVSDVRGRFDGHEYSEGFPLPIAEAMATGSIVFCRNTNGVNEYLLDKINGFLFTNMNDLSNQLVYVRTLNDEQKKEISYTACLTFQKKFNRENTKKQILISLDLL